MAGFSTNLLTMMAGYKSWRGTVTTAEQLWDIIEGLKQNGLLEYTHLITGSLSYRFPFVTRSNFNLLTAPLARNAGKQPVMLQQQSCTSLLHLTRQTQSQ